MIEAEIKEKHRSRNQKKGIEALKVFDMEKEKRNTQRRIWKFMRW